MSLLFFKKRGKSVHAVATIFFIMGVMGTSILLFFLRRFLTFLRPFLSWLSLTNSFSPSFLSLWPYIVVFPNGQDQIFIWKNRSAFFLAQEREFVCWFFGTESNCVVVDFLFASSWLGFRLYFFLQFPGKQECWSNSVPKIPPLQKKLCFSGKGFVFCPLRSLFVATAVVWIGGNKWRMDKKREWRRGGGKSLLGWGEGRGWIPCGEGGRG